MGPFFFEERGRTVSVTAARYEHMLRHFFVPELRRRGISLGRCWFQQDGATAHTTAAVLSFLQNTFGNRVLSRNADVQWPPRSPDLTSPDFFLWGWLKSVVYRTPLTTAAQLKRRLRRTVRMAPAAALKGLRNSLAARLRLCLREKGGQVEQYLQ